MERDLLKMTISFFIITALGNVQKFKAAPLFENGRFYLKDLELYLGWRYVDASDMYFSQNSWEKIMEAAYEEYRFKYSILFV